MKQSAAVMCDQLRRMREAAENTLRQYPEHERREAARALGIEHFLPDPQEPLPLPRVA